jgi:tetratricopeptide (TPR) repeat protein
MTMAGRHLQRRTSFLHAKRPLGSGTKITDRLVVTIAITALLSSNTAIAQGDKGNRDYYHPGTTTDEKADWENAHKFHLGPALAAMKRGDWKVARDNLQFILYVFPNSPQALNSISELCVDKWKSAHCDADAWFEKAIAVNPDVATTWTLLGIHLQRKKRPSEAIQHFQHALKLNPNDLNAHYNMGLAYFDLKEYDKANEQAQISYALGAPLPGLRNLLKRSGAWKPVSLTTPPAAAETTPK